MFIANFLRGILATSFILMLPVFAAAQGPKIVHVNLQERSAAGGLQAEFRLLVNGQVPPAWIAYAVPAVSGERVACCGDYSGRSDNWEQCCGVCQLEGSDGLSMRSPGHEAYLESSPNILVLFRIENRQVEKVRVFSEDCTVDAGGKTVYWLSQVQPAGSVSLLASLVMDSSAEFQNSGEHEHVGDGAIAAIALHADPAADRALEGFVATGQPERLRERAAFWLASARGHQGYEVLLALAHHDADADFRTKLMFDLSITKDPEAVNTLIVAARVDQSPRVRSQALFWLAQKAGKKAVLAITGAIENDPETEVKKRAVFAVSQLPKDQAVPLLIQTARTNQNRAVRKAAMFWLGQSGDPRALAFFEQILTQKE